MNVHVLDTFLFMKSAVIVLHWIGTKTNWCVKYLSAHAVQGHADILAACTGGILHEVSAI